MRKLKVSEWRCAIRFNEDGENLISGSTMPFSVIKDSYRYWTADPFLFEKDGTLYLFFEMFDRIKRKGLIGYRTVSEDAIGDMNVVYEADCHLSYPFIFEENGEIFIIPESSKSKKLIKLRAVEFPDKWEEISVLVDDVLVDTTLLEKGGVKYYISERVCTENCFDRVDLFFEENGKMYECKNNPVKIDADNARGAGKILPSENGLIRPAQNCGRDYGEKLNFNRIANISKTGFSEELVMTISVNDIEIDSREAFSGIHTYNKLGNVEVVDLKVHDSFNLLNIFGAVLKRMGMVLK